MSNFQGFLQTYSTPQVLTIGFPKCSVTNTQTTNDFTTLHYLVDGYESDLINNSQPHPY